MQDRSPERKPRILPNIENIDPILETRWGIQAGENYLRMQADSGKQEIDNLALALRARSLDTSLKTLFIISGAVIGSSSFYISYLLGGRLIQYLTR